jgi:hypothetical protein
MITPMPGRNTPSRRSRNAGAVAMSISPRNLMMV